MVKVDKFDFFFLSYVVMKKNYKTSSDICDTVRENYSKSIATSSKSDL